jgi:hypothetical protein
MEADKVITTKNLIRHISTESSCVNAKEKYNFVIYGQYAFVYNATSGFINLDSLCKAFDINKNEFLNSNEYLDEVSKYKKICGRDSKRENDDEYNNLINDFEKLYSTTSTLNYSHDPEIAGTYISPRFLKSLIEYCKSCTPRYVNTILTSYGKILKNNILSFPNTLVIRKRGNGYYVSRNLKVIEDEPIVCFRMDPICSYEILVRDS